jgi:diguanylate cyclase (GGDEF)-like protein
MNIGLLISELLNDKEREICRGADCAAKEAKVNLTILPGKYIITDMTMEDTRPYEYQHQAIFDYINTNSFDVLVIDIDEIGESAPILKKQAFLKRFNNIPILTITKQDGFKCINEIENASYAQIGYEAVYDAIEYAKSRTLPVEQEIREFEEIEIDEDNAQQIITEISHILIDREYDPDDSYNNIAKRMAQAGLNFAQIMLYKDEQKNNFKKNWKVPRTIYLKAQIENGEIKKNNKENIIETKDIFNYKDSERKTVFARTMFYKEKQLGIFMSEFIPVYLKKGFTDQLLNIITGVLRIIYLEYNYQKTTEELMSVQEELAKDDSVLDHIGDKDYLTGKLNRRGFFAEAYDLLKQEFKENTYAIVSYIDMDSLKNINQIFGHDEGDRAVKRVASLLEEVFGKESIFGRIRGDEFAVIQVFTEEGMGEQLRRKMIEQNARLMTESVKYLNHLQYSICEFDYDENLSLREMLKETDENLKQMKKLDLTNK